jgi:low temperature requirement protein LtrA
MASSPDWPGLVRGLFVLTVLWWTWTGYAWLTSVVDPEEGAVRLVIFAAMAAMVVAALAVPGAFGDDALAFACAYAIVRIAHIGLFLIASRDEPLMRRSVIGLAVGTTIGVGLLMAASATDGAAQAGLWCLAIVLDLGLPFLFWAEGWQLVPAHFAERHGLILIIALGESIVAIGIGTSELERDTTYALSVVVAFAGVAALWWAYFDFTALAAERALRRASPGARGPLARDVFTFFHYPVVLGIIFYAVAAKKTLEHPLDPLSDAGRWALGLGVAIFLCGFALMRYRVVRRVAWERLAAAAVALVLAVGLDGTDAVVTLGVVIAVLVLSVAIETARLREFRAEVRAG